MEQRERFQLKLESFDKAVQNFDVSLNIDLNQYSDEVADSIKNGRIQKFEFCTELTWKAIKEYLLYIHGIAARSPKQSIKEFFLIGGISNDEYETMLNMLDDRNKLSHVYKEEFFDSIYKKLADYITIMKKIRAILFKSLGEESF